MISDIPAMVNARTRLCSRELVRGVSIGDLVSVPEVAVERYGPNDLFGHAVHLFEIFHHRLGSTRSLKEHV